MLVYYIYHTASRVIKQVSTVLPQGLAEIDSVYEFEVPYKLHWKPLNDREMIAYKVQDDAVTLATEEEIEVFLKEKTIDDSTIYWKLDSDNKKVIASDDEIDAAKVDPIREETKYKLKEEARKKAITDISNDLHLMEQFPSLSNYFKILRDSFA